MKWMKRIFKKVMKRFAADLIHEAYTDGFIDGAERVLRGDLISVIEKK